MKAALKIVDALDSVSDVILKIILVTALAFGVYSIWDARQVYEAADAIQYTAYRPMAEDAESFDELRQINPEVFAWLTVNGTPIDYPVVQAKNNEKYLNTDAKGNFALSGALFLDYRYDPHFNDFNSVVYGHNMEKKQMFGCLSDYTEQSYFDEHPYGNLFFDGKDHGIEFFALILTDGYDRELYANGLTEESERQTYLELLGRKALTQRETELRTDDRLLLLSTCTTQITNGRYVLVGKLTDELHLQEKEEKSAKLIRGAGTDAIKTGMLTAVPVWIWCGVLAALLLAQHRLMKNKTSSGVQGKERIEREG